MRKGLNMKKGIIVIMAVMVLALVGMVSAAPTGPRNITQQATSRYTGSTGGWNISAQAGNVTELTIDATSTTQTWQGYYGNVIGSILLADSSNNTLIDWTITGVQGQVYASRVSSISDWTTINCSNSTHIIAEDVALNSTGKADSVNNTFNTSGIHNAFYVGAKQIPANGCPVVTLKNSTGYSSDWKEVLLNSGVNMVYTALLTTDKNGFNNSNYDFQMIVGEDGHSGNTATTPYYFWIELT